MATPTQYVTLGIDDDVFAIPVHGVREILEMSHISRLPHAPPCVLGMVDVRGQGYPVVDLRLRLGLPPLEPTHATRIIILNAEGGDSGSPGPNAVGLVAERVFEVTEFDDGRLEPAPAVGGSVASGCVAGIGRRRERFVVVFDVSALLRIEELPGSLLAVGKAA